MSSSGVVEIQSLEAFWISLGEAASEGCHLALFDISDRWSEGRFRNLVSSDMLSDAELARLDTYKSKHAAWQYKASHVALRLLLARGLGVLAAQVPFRRPGERFQRPGPVAAGCFITASLSHSGQFAAVAVSRNAAVGVDVEPLARAEQAHEVVQMFLGEDELAHLAKMPVEQRAAAALSSWCLKEAVLKAVGTGFQIDPKTIRLNYDPDAANEMIVLKPVGAGPSLCLRAIRHPAAPDILVALALKEGCSRVHFSYASLECLVRISRHLAELKAEVAQVQSVNMQSDTQASPLSAPTA